MTTLRQQAQQSGLTFVDSDNTSDEPQWNENDWPPLLDGARPFHASVVLDNPKLDDSAQTVVVLGGHKQGQGYTNSVLLLRLAKENLQWREGPPLNNNRALHAAVVCNGGVYVIGGYNGSSCLDTIERLDVDNLCSESMESSTSNQWTTLNCRMSTTRQECSAVTVYNRYIVVMGGYNGQSLSSVDIFDTAVESNHTVIAGPSMTVPRFGCASAVIGHRILVVGGGEDGTDLNSEEYLEFHDASGNETVNTVNAVFPSSCRWTYHHEFFAANRNHAVLALGSCLIVMGRFASPTIPIVFDTCRNTVWTLPGSLLSAHGCSAVVHSKGIAMIGGCNNIFGCGKAHCATLSLIDKNTWCFRRLIEQGPSTMFGSRNKAAPERATVSNESDEHPAKLATENFCNEECVE